MAKKPWRVVQVSQDENTGRFTREQAAAAVRAVKERNEARKKNARRPSTSKPAGATRTSEASAPKSESVATVRVRSKSKA
jgi:hypothetical protein